MRCLLIPLVCLGLLTVNSTSAAVLADYPFDGSSAASTDTDPNSVASSLTFGAGFSQLRYSTSTGSPSTPSIFVFGSDTGTTATEAEAVDANDYWAFIISPNAGIELDLTDLTFRIGGSASINTTIFVRSSLDGFAATLGSFNHTGAGVSATDRVVNLSGDSFQNLTAPVEFRFYAFDNSTSTSNAGARLDSIVLNGNTAVVPEPSAVLVLALGLAGLSLRRRHRSRH